MSPALVYHAGGLGDFVLSLPALFRTVGLPPGEPAHFWGPPDRLALLPGFLPPPPLVLRFGHTLWGERPHPEVTRFLAGCSPLLAFGGLTAPLAFSRLPGDRVLAIAGFPGRGGLRVPAHQARRLDELGVPRVSERWLPGWRHAVRPAGGTGEVVVHPGSGDRRKNAPPRLWDEAVTALRHGAKKRVRVVVGPAERDDPAWRALAVSADAVSVCEEVQQLLGALSNADVFLGNDSGASHLAALLGVPTVALFGPSDPALWRPLGPRVAVVRTQAPCAPCTHGAPFGCRDTLCTSLISAQDVVEKALALLDQPPCHTTQSTC